MEKDNSATVIQLDTIARTIQTWIDFDIRHHKENPQWVGDEKAIFSLPTNPTHGQLKRWIETLDAAKAALNPLQHGRG